MNEVNDTLYYFAFSVYSLGYGERNFQRFI